MASESTARLPPTPLRRRMYLLKRTSRSISTAGSSTRNGEEDEDADSPPTLFEDPESPDYEHEMEGEEEDEQGGPHSTYTQAEEEGEAEDGEADFEDHDVPAPRPWYKPSIPVLLALAPPIGNWLTGGDHLKDLLLLLLLIFYLHQLVEVPWSLYHAARPRRSLSSPVPNPATLTAARAKSELRAFEILLLLFCLLAPALGVFLLRSLASLSGTSPNSREPVINEHRRRYPLASGAHHFCASDSPFLSM
ncbi:hypothetical protein K438DRAFT_1257174 [Mycena galopus ATCC 62051]|nr:hypothetical protein K438DRAFT_1257174 [Mycena galopus ATCC 62051]